MKKNSKNKFVTFSILIIFFLTIFTYNYYFYIYLNKINFSENPFYIINKSLAISAVFGIFVAYTISSLSKFNIKFAKRNLALKRFFGLGGFYFACIHVFFAFRIIEPLLYPQFFDLDGDFSIRGQLIILFGVCGLLLFLSPAITSIQEISAKMNRKRWLIYQRIGYFAFTIILFHIIYIGADNWFANTKFFFLPSPNFIAFLLVSTALILRISALIIKRK